MSRCYFFSLLMFLLVGLGANSVLADDITLDLVYSSSSMTWEVYAEITNGVPDTVDGSNGLAAVRLLIDNIDFGTNGDAVTIASGIGAIDPIDPGGVNERPPILQTTGGTLDILYGQDLSEVFQQVVGNVGNSGPVLIADGTFSGAAPEWGDDDSGETSAGLFLDIPPTLANDDFGNALDPDNTVLTESHGDPSFDPCDFNFDGWIDGLDLGIILGKWGQTTTPDMGELNGTPPVDGLDLGILLGCWNPPPVLAVSIPEPSSLALLMLACGGIACMKRVG